MKIGEVAKKAHVSIQTLHYYERVGMLKPKSRLASGYRIYDDSAVHVIRFIKHAQELGFSLDEIRGLINLKASTRLKCKAVQTKATQHLNDVNLKIAKLEAMRDTLAELIRDCKMQKTDAECPILDCLDAEEFHVTSKLHLKR